MQNKTRYACLLSLLLISFPATAANTFQLTSLNDTNIYSEPNFAIGGGCVSSPIGKRIEHVNGEIKLKKVFGIQHCGDAGLRLSINGVGYRATNTTNQTASYSFLHKRYQNKRFNLSVKVKNLGYAYKDNVDENDCPSNYVNIQLDIHFQGTRKVVPAVIYTGC